MSRSYTNYFGAIIAVACALLSVGAAAQTQGFALDRYDPAERGSDFFAVDSLDLRGSGRVAAGATFDWAYKPLVAYDREGDERTSPVRYQTLVHVGAAVVLWERLRLGANLPVLMSSKARPYTITQGTVDPSDSAGVGDLRLGADVRLLGEYGDAATLSVGSRVYLPTGSRDNFTGDETVRVAPRLNLAGDLGAVEYALRAGFDFFRQGSDFAGHPFGHTLEFGAGVGVRFYDDRFLLGPELFGSTVVSDHGDGFFDVPATPIEAILGLHYFSQSGWRAGLAAGAGMSRGLGASEARALATIEWAAPYEKKPVRKDTDGDGIYDDEDACVEVPGEPNEDLSKHGCPAEDRDGDGILDDDDACVDVPGVANEDLSKHGCPEPLDSDGDGILDDDDACVDVAGEQNDDPKLNGCPPADTDGDGILDRDDACPKVKGKPSSDPEKHGCPKAKIEGKQVKILERIEFDTAKATIRSESLEILRALQEILEEHHEIQLLSVEGHTDNRGGAWFNRKLSRDRAQSVVDWLVEHGIDESRLTAKGFGPDKPLDDNDTESGRQNNRRVEFHIEKMGKNVKATFKQAE